MEKDLEGSMRNGPKIFKVAKVDNESALSKTLQDLELKYESIKNLENLDNIPVSLAYDIVEKCGENMRAKFGVPEEIDPNIKTADSLKNFLRPKPEYWEYIGRHFEENYSDSIKRIFLIEDTAVYKIIAKENVEIIEQPQFSDFLKCFLLLCLHHYVMHADIIMIEDKIFNKDKNNERIDEKRFRDFLHDNEKVEKGLLSDFLLIKNQGYSLVDDDYEYDDIEAEYKNLLNAIYTIRRSRTFTQARKIDLQPISRPRKIKSTVHFDLIELALWLGGIVAGKMPSGAITQNVSITHGFGVELCSALVADVTVKGINDFSITSTKFRDDIQMIKRQDYFREIELNSLDLYEQSKESFSAIDMIENMFNYIECDFGFGFDKRTKRRPII